MISRLFHTRPILLPAAVALLALAACTRGEAPVLPSATTPPETAATRPATSPSPVVATPGGTAAPGASPPAATTPPGSGQQALLHPDIPVPPERDLFDIARRITLKSSVGVPRIASPLPPGLKQGDVIDWNVNRAGGNARVRARVVHVSENAYWLFEERFLPGTEAVAEVAGRFESSIWPSVVNALGPIATPGVDGDPRMVIFHGEILPGAAGYFSGSDEYPISIQPDSNQREAIYIASNQLVLGSAGYMATLAHELQHAIHWAADPSEESWVNEGIAEVAAELAGFPPGSISAFLSRPNTSLVQWEPELFQASPNYGASALFFNYIASRYGGVETLRRIIEHPADGIDSINAVLAGFDPEVTFRDLFADFVVANLVDDVEGRYSHPDRQVRRPRTSTVLAPRTVEGSVQPLGTVYYRVQAEPGDLDIRFTGSPTGRIFPAEPHSTGSCWWSNAGDSIDSTLTRRVDLSDVESATFEFWTWFSIEEDWDYAYVAVSTDDGTTWDLVPTALSSNANPNGTAFGPGLTGASEGWARERADLAPYAGSEVLLRLEYITDDAIHDRGACFDDFAIPEIGWTDTTSTAADWTADGFALVDSSRPIEYLVQVVRRTARGASTVERLVVAADGTGSISVTAPPSGDAEMFLAVSVLSPEISGFVDYIVKFE